MSVEVRQRNISRIEAKIDEALEFAFYDNPREEVERIALQVLDDAQDQGWLNSMERMLACDYIMEIYGLNME